ncbi:hypothetical protein Poly30_48250 [Planctomycetes bacterium Poly30]|uniref:Uncharacterized protein n=1 Tax=Saltatorellus ferox TaxID=2528018 RepID=A0A518EYV9_9BACT|nr:hypothetical protein Poly30_48250 [Planctomycetes bacterium Poly30]
MVIPLDLPPWVKDLDLSWARARKEGKAIEMRGPTLR